MKVKEIQPYCDVIEHKELHTRKEYKVAREMLLIKYYPVVRQTAEALCYHWPHIDLERMVTMGLLEVMQSIETYNPNWVSHQKGRKGRKTKLSSWVFGNLKRACWSCVRRGQMGKRKCKAMLSLNSPIYDTNGKKTEFTNLLKDGNYSKSMEDYIRDDYINEIKKILSKEDLLLLNQYLVSSHLTNRAMAKKYGMSYEAQRCRRIRLIKKIRRIMGKLEGKIIVHE